MLRSLTHPDSSYDRLGFRLRGLDITRLETLVDAAFAFSITMLALSPDRIPTTFDQMYDLFRGIPAFLFSLSLLMLFWNSHVVFSRRFGLEDTAVKMLSIAYVGVMLVYVYPLKFMATAFFAFYVPALRTPDYLSSGTTTDLAAMFAVMSGGFVLLSLIDAAMYAHASRRGAGLGLSDHERLVTRCEIGSALLYAAVGSLSIVLAYVFRGGMWVISAGFVYASLAVLMPVYWIRFGPSGEACREARGEFTAG